MEVFNNHMVAHVWAQQKQKRGRSNNGNIYFEGPVLYSYGPHYPLGVFATPKGPVFLNSSDSSRTTNGKHKPAARAAFYHAAKIFHVPELSAICEIISRVEPYNQTLPKHLAEQFGPRILAYLSSNWQAFPANSESANWLLRAARYRGSWAARYVKLEAKAYKAAEKARIAREKSLTDRGALLAITPWAKIRDQAWLGASTYKEHELRMKIKEFRAARLATPSLKKHHRNRAILFKRESALRGILKRAEACKAIYGKGHYVRVERLEARKALINLRNELSGLGDLNTLQWRGIVHSLILLLNANIRMPASLRVKAESWLIDAKTLVEQRETEDEKRRHIEAAHRQTLSNLVQFNAARRAYNAHLSSLDESRPGAPRVKARFLDQIFTRIPDPEPWASQKGFELRPDMAKRAARISEAAQRIAEPLKEIRDQLHAEADRREAKAKAEEAARAAKFAAMSEGEKLELWDAGMLSASEIRQISQTRGPLLRAVNPEIDGCNVKGGTLETSEGASVPLSHAFRVFQFVAACRAENRPWVQGYSKPKRIRVGHFEVDEVKVSGDFIAGCHHIRWPEIERLANKLGVADCLASLPEIRLEMEKLESQ